MRERMLEIVSERPHLALLDELNGCRRHHLVVVVHELRDRVFDVATPRLEDDVAFANSFVSGHVLDEEHHPASDLAGQQVVEVLGGARSQASVGPGQRRAHGGDVLRRVEQAEQAENAVDRPSMLFLQHFAQNRLRVEPAGHKQVVVQA